MIIGYRLKYKCVKHNEYQEITCDNKREALGYLGDMRRFLTDYKITELHKVTEFELLPA
jgi:hypothetical protein